MQEDCQRLKLCRFEVLVLQEIWLILFIDITDMETVANLCDENMLYPDLEKICLLCLKENSGIVPVFDFGEQSIPTRIMACTSLEVNPVGSMPKLICQDCRIQLERSYYFRKRAQYSYNKLKKHIRLITAGKKSKVFDKNDDDDDEIDFGYSINFLKTIEEEEKCKRERELQEFEDKLKERFRVEETNRIFEEARNFLNTKASEYLKSTSSKLSENLNKALDDNNGRIKSCKADDKNTDAVSPSPEPEEDVGDKPSELSEEASEKLFKFTYSDTNDDALEAFYLIKNSEDEEIDEIPSQKHNEEASEDSNNVDDLNIDELPDEEERVSEGPVETINLDDCSLGAMEDDENDFDDRNAIDVTDNFIEEILPSMDEDDSSNQSQMALAAVIQKSLLSQENLKLNGNIKFKVEQVMEGVTHVKVITEEGNVIDIEVQNETEAESLIEKNVAGSNEELKIFRCNLCPQAFTRRSLLLRHKSVHVKSTGYSCKFCQKWFACKSSMNRHVRVHTGEKPFECDQCGRKFIQKEILKRHMVVHTGVRPYPCPHCDKAFVQKQLLRQHINMKHTDNPVVEMHECFLCPKTFCHASGLSRHLLVHSGVSYQCKKCGKKFNDKSAVKRHTMTVHAKTKVLKVGDNENEGEDKSTD